MTCNTPWVTPARHQCPRHCTDTAPDVGPDVVHHRDGVGLLSVPHRARVLLDHLVQLRAVRHRLDVVSQELSALK